MNRFLLLVFFFLTVSTTLCIGQPDLTLNRAEDFAVLAASRVTNQGNTDVYGDLGVVSGTPVVDTGTLKVDGDKEIGTTLASDALQDAQNLYDNLINYPNATPLFSSTLGNHQRLNAGVYKINGNASLKGGLVLDGQGNPDATFVIIVDGDLTSNTDKTYINLINGAQPKNVFWIIRGSVDTGKTSLFQGTVIARDGIRFGAGGVIIGRAISLKGEVNLETNLVFMPNIIIANLSVQKETDVKDYRLGSLVTYTIKATNLGPDNASGVVVKEQVPSGLEFVKVESTTKGTYNTNTNQWLIGNLAVGEIVTLRLTFKIINPGNIKNRVVIIGENPDPSPDDDEDEVEIQLPDLGVTKTVNGGPAFYVGENVQYQITVTNNADAAETNVKVREKLPAGLEYVSFAANAGITYNPATGLINIPTLAGKSSATITINAKLIKAGKIENVATIIGKDPDPNNPSDPNNPGDPGDGGYTDTDPGNDKDVVVIPEVKCPTPTAAITGETAICANKTELTYSVTPIIGATYAFTLPLGWTIVRQENNTIVVNAGPAGGANVIKVKVTDQCKNEVTAELNVQVTGLPAVPVITGEAAICFNGAGVTFTAGGAGEGLTYTWSVDANLEIVGGANGASVVVKARGESLLGGTVSLKVTNNCSLESIATKVITVIPAPAAPVSIIGDTDICAGKQVIFRTAAITGATGYTWTLPAGWEFAPNTATNTNQVTVIAGTTGGAISVIANNTCTSSAAATLAVTVTNTPVAPATITGEVTPCIGTEQVYTIPAVDGATRYVWTLPSGWTIIGDGTGNTIRVKVGSSTATGTIKAAVTNKCFTGEQASLEINPNKKPDMPGAITGPAVDICAASTGHAYSIAAVTGATGYTWTVPAGWEITSGQGTTSITVAAGTTGGTVKVVASNACGDSAERTYTTVITAVPATPASISGSATMCAGTESTYSVTAVSNVIYTWTVPAGWEIVSGQGTAQVRVKAGPASGNVEVSASNTCGANSNASRAVTVSDKPAAPAAINGETTPCAGTELTYTIEPVQGATSYVWDIPTGWTVKGSRTTNTITLVAGGVEGTIAVAAVNACGASAKASLTIIPNNIPAIPGEITAPSSVCAVSQGNTYSISAVAGATGYTWSVPAGWEITSGQGTTSIMVSAGTAGGTVKVKASNVCGSSAERTVNVSVSSLPAIPVSISGSNNLCEGVVETYTVPAVAGVTYNWTVPATGGWEIVEGQGTAQVKVKIGAASGSVEVSAANACGTSSNASRAVAVTNLPAAPAAITGIKTACIGTELTYSIDAVAGATGYTWTVPATWTLIGDATGTSIRAKVGTGSGDIKVAVTNRCGAGAQASLAVAPTLAPETPGAITNDFDVCVSSEGNVFSVAAVSGATSYTWSVPAGWIITGGQGTNSITVTATSTGGAVSVTATNECGTSPASTRNIDITLPPAAVTRIMDNSNVCDGLAFTAEAVEGATSYTWSVTPGFTIVSGQGTATITVKADSPNAMGQVSVVANNGDCASSAESSAPIDASLADGQLSLPKAFSPNGDGKNDTWMVSNLLKFPDNEVVIFNRWGSEVYKQRGYKNDWVGKGLEQGTYFYKVRVKLCDGVYKEFTGYVAIFR